MNNGLIVFFFLISVSFLLGAFITGNNTDAKFFEAAFKPNDDIALIQGFRFPLLWYVTIPFYFVFQDFAFTIVPLLCFIVGFAFLAKLFQEFNIKLRWLLFCWSLVFLSIRFLGQYTRDSLMFVIASAFAYFFFLAWYKNKTSLIALTILGFLAFLTRPQGALLIFLFIILLTRNAFFFAFIYFGAKDTIQTWFKGLNYLLNPKPEYFLIIFSAFGNYLNVLALALFCFSKDKLLFLILVLSVLVSFISALDAFYLDGNAGSFAFRYGFVSMPFLTFLVSKELQNFQKRRW